MSLPRLFVFFLFWSGLTAQAEPVALKDGLGQGLLFTYRSNCYVVFPAHVHPEGPVVNLFTAAPQASGTAAIYFRRTEADIAIGLVRGSARDRCDTPFSKLTKDVSRVLNRTRSATLERINPQGTLERLAMRIDRTPWLAADERTQSGLYHYVLASTDQASGESREVYQGTSGAILYVEDTPVAMVVSAPDATSVRALRMEEILTPVARWLRSGSFGSQAEGTSTDSSAPEGMPFSVTEWSGQLVDPNVPPTGLANGTAPFRVAAQAGRVSFTLQLSESAPVRVRELLLTGAADTTSAATPRAITIDIDRGRPGAANFTPFASADMTPDEPLSIPINSFSRQLRVTISSTWAPGLPVEVSSVRVIPAN
ncbi:MAG: hypothetical protein AAF718_05080 [Pseudomonadota bacterium]